MSWWKIPTLPDKAQPTFLLVYSVGSIRAKLFANSPIEWNRLSAFQDVTLRLIARRLLPLGADDVQFQGERENHLSTLPPPEAPRRFHLYASPLNMGAEDLTCELALLFPAIRITTRIQELDGCEVMLIYLNSRTWTVGKRGELAREISLAMQCGVGLLLAHEMPGIDPPEWRGACEVWRSTV